MNMSKLFHVGLGVCLVMSYVNYGAGVVTQVKKIDSCWYKNPRTIILTALSVAALAAGGAYAWKQRQWNGAGSRGQVVEPETTALYNLSQLNELHGVQKVVVCGYCTYEKKVSYMLQQRSGSADYNFPVYHASGVNTLFTVVDRGLKHSFGVNYDQNANMPYVRTGGSASRDPIPQDNGGTVHLFVPLTNNVPLGANFFDATILSAQALDPDTAAIVGAPFFQRVNKEIVAQL